MSVRSRLLLTLMVFGALCPGMLNAQWITFTDKASTHLALAGYATDAEEKDFALGDLDQDGDLDLVNVRKEPFYGDTPKTHILLMNVNGVLTDQTATYAPGFNSNPSLARVVLIADFDADTWLDVVVVNTNAQGGFGPTYQTHYYRNLGDSGTGWLGLQLEPGRFPNFSPRPLFCAANVGDIDGDGDLDIFFGDYNNNLESRVVVNNGAGFFTDETSTRFPGGNNAASFSVEINIADADGDGDLDLFESTGAPEPRMKIHVNNGTGVFNSTYLVGGTQTVTYTHQIGDLNNDGKVDIYVGRDNQDSYAINTTPPGGPLNFAITTLANAPKTSNFAGNAYLVDLDGDGDLDLAMADADVDIPGCARRAVIYRNGTIGPPQAQVLVDPWALVAPPNNITNVHTQGTHDLAVFDIDGDGLMDIFNGRCTGYHVFIQDGNPFSLQVWEPSPGGLQLVVRNGAPSTQTHMLVSFIPWFPVGSGPFLGLDPTSFDNYVALSPIGEPIVSFTDVSGNWSWSMPGGILPHPLTLQWRAAQLAGPGGLQLTNVVSRTF